MGVSVSRKVVIMTRPSSKESMVYVIEILASGIRIGIIRCRRRRWDDCQFRDPSRSSISLSSSCYYTSGARRTRYFALFPLPWKIVVINDTLDLGILKYQPSSSGVGRGRNPK